MYGGWGWASGWNRGIFPGSWNAKEAVPPRTTDTSGLTDTTETQLRPRGELRKRWRGGEWDGRRNTGREREWCFILQFLLFPLFLVALWRSRGTYCTYHQNPLGHLDLHRWNWTSDLPESPPPLLTKHLELSELHNCTTFNQNHKQSREELCLLMYPVWDNSGWSGLDLSVIR